MVEMITNGSFEGPYVGPTTNTTPVDWQHLNYNPYNYNATSSYIFPRTDMNTNETVYEPTDGDDYAVFRTGTSGSRSFATSLYQDVAFVPGETYTISIDVDSLNTSTSSHNVLQVWLAQAHPSTGDPRAGQTLINFKPLNAGDGWNVDGYETLTATFTVPSWAIGIGITATGLQSGSFAVDNVSLTPICFTRGTSILTPNGDVLVEDLQVGSRVETLDHGPQTVRWIGSTVRVATGACAPVHIRAGALDNDRDLFVSQQHRMVLRGARAELMFGDHEVLVPAKSLVNDCSVRIVEGGEVEYFHILFDNHEIIYAEGAMAESLHLGKQSFDVLSHASIQEIEMLFPELCDRKTSLPPTARQVLRNYEVQALLHAS